MFGIVRAVSLAIAFLSFNLAGIPAANAADASFLAVTDGSFTNPTTHKAHITMKNVSSQDVLCDVKITGIIRGHALNGQELTARQSSDAVADIRLAAGRNQERQFDFKNAVMRMRTVWGDDNAILVEVDSRSLTADCRNPSDGNTVMCEWRGAKVHVDQWLECPDCLYRYCQCQPNGKWGNCGSSTPSTGACDWSSPNWSENSCSQGGTKPCDWSNPDWSNPSCSGQ